MASSLLRRAQKTTLLFYRLKLKGKAELFNHVRRFPDCFGEMIGDKKKVSVLDAGGGPFPVVGTEWPGVDVDFHLCDIFADEYREMMVKKKVVPVIPVEKQDMQALTYQDDTFDIVHCMNALDHVRDAKAALEELKRVCKPCGYVHLKHFPREGESRKYGGLHYWNIDLVDGKAVAWNRTESFGFEGFDSHWEDGMIVSVMKKCNLVCL